MTTWERLLVVFAIHATACHWPAPRADGGNGSVDVSAVFDSGRVDVSADFGADIADVYSVCSFQSLGCDPIRNAGCPAGTTCSVVDWLTPRFGCVAPGTLGHAQPCLQPEDNCPSGQECHCAPGMQCHPDLHVCLNLCCLSAGDGPCGPANYCTVPIDAMTTYRFAMCTTNNKGCDDVAVDGGCAPGFGCYPTQPFGYNACVEPGPGTLGGPCDGTISNCEVGLVCVPRPDAGDAAVSDAAPPMNGVCRERCRLRVGHEPCSSGTCTAIPGYPTEFSACIP